MIAEAKLSAAAADHHIGDKNAKTHAALAPTAGHIRFAQTTENLLGKAGPVIPYFRPHETIIPVEINIHFAFGKFSGVADEIAKAVAQLGIEVEMWNIR